MVDPIVPSTVVRPARESGEIDQIVAEQVEIYYEPIPTRPDTIKMILMNLAAVQRWKEDGCPGGIFRISHSYAYKIAEMIALVGGLWALWRML